MHVSDLSADVGGPRPLPALHAEGDPRAAARDRPTRIEARDRRRRRIDGALRHGRDAKSCATSTRVLILACGTSYYAGLVARYWIEAHRRHARAASSSASEYRYRDVDRRTRRQLVVTISQSGETLDTMEALKHAEVAGPRAHARRSATCRKARSRAPVEARLLHARRRRDRRRLRPRPSPPSSSRCSRSRCALARAAGGCRAKHEADCLEQLRFVPGSVQHALNLEPQIAGLGRAASRSATARAVPRPRHALPDRAGRRA